MSKTILLTGATDGIGLEAAKRLALQGHRLLVHGRNPTKLEAVKRELAELTEASLVEGYLADLSSLSEVATLAEDVCKAHKSLDVLINNAGVFQTSKTKTSEGFDTRFVVNTIAPYLLTKRLLPLMGSSGRVINLSSAAQAPVNLRELATHSGLPSGAAYAQSKLAITMWSYALAQKLGEEGPSVIAVNPGSFLGTKMVKEAYGMEGGDVGVGADILVRAALSDDFRSCSGQYFDNDSGRFAAPYPDALDPAKTLALTEAVEAIIAKQLGDDGMAKTES